MRIVRDDEFGLETSADALLSPVFLLMIPGLTAPEDVLGAALDSMRDWPSSARGEE